MQINQKYFLIFCKNQKILKAIWEVLLPQLKVTKMHWFFTYGKYT